MTIRHDTPELVQRLEARIEKLRGDVVGVNVGPFGINYAKFHEYGTKFSVKMYRWLLANLWKERATTGSKGVLQFTGKGKTRAARIRARPFLGPAVKARAPMVIDILRASLLDDSKSLTPAFTRAATILKTEIIRNIRKERIVDQRGLLNSIRYEYIKRGQ